MPSPPLRPWLGELLACPSCRREMVVSAESITCGNGHSFPVVDGIPRFTPPSTYADSFGFEWTSFPRLQLDSEGRQESETTFAEKTGISPEDIKGATVLDGGCGMGRFTDVVARWGAARVVGIDLSGAVTAAAANVQASDNAAIAQADLRQLPFSDGSFDIAFSIGVLHHTPNTFESFRRLAAMIRPGGTLAVWVYSHRLMWSQLGAEVLRPVTKRLKPETLLRAVKWTVPKVTKVKQAVPRGARIVDAVLPVSNHPDPEWRILDTFDWYSPEYQWKHTYSEVEGWFTKLGFVNLRRGRVPISVTAQRPA